MPLTVVSRDRTRPARFDEHLSYAILIAKCRVEELFDDSMGFVSSGSRSKELSAQKMETFNAGERRQAAAVNVPVLEVRQPNTELELGERISLEIEK
jgi:hypothetical protein